MISFDLLSRLLQSSLKTPPYAAQNTDGYLCQKGTELTQIQPAVCCLLPPSPFCKSALSMCSFIELLLPRCRTFHFPLLNHLPFSSFLNRAMSPTEILCKGLAGWRQSVPLSLEKSLQDEGQEHLRVVRHFWRILFRALWKYVRLTHPEFSEGGPKDGRMSGCMWIGKQLGKRKRRSWSHGKIQFWKHARKSLVKSPAQSNIRRCDNMVQGSLKPSLEKLQWCRQHSFSGHFAPLWTVPIGKNVALSLQCKPVLLQVRPTTSHPTIMHGCGESGSIFSTCKL